MSVIVRVSMSAALAVTLPAMVAVAAVPSAPPSSPSSSEWQVAEVRSLDVDGTVVAVSPDGRWLAGVGGDSTFCLWAVDSLTPDCDDEELPIFVSPAFPAITWSPDSSAVAYQLDYQTEGFDSDIYVYEVDAGRSTNLTDDGFADTIGYADSDVPFDELPTWSPDGAELAFRRTYWDTDGSRHAIVRLDRDGGEPVEVVALKNEVTFTAFAQVFTPLSWLPDDTILFSQFHVERENPSNGLWSVDLDGTDMRQVLGGSTDTDVPLPMLAGVNATGDVVALSSLLPFSASGPGDSDSFWTFQPATAEVQLLPNLGGVEPATPAAFSPDGATAFAVYQAGGDDDEATMATIDIASGSTAMLGPPFTDFPVRAISPTWSTEDTVLVYGPGETASLVTLEPAGA